jgi:hypothetical protein
MFVKAAEAATQEPISANRLQAIVNLSKIPGPRKKIMGSGCQCNSCLQALALVDLYSEYKRVRAECNRLRGAALAETGLFTPEQIERLLEVEL